MPAYYDTGVLVPLYVSEVFSDAVSSLVEDRREAILLNALQQLEFENSLRLKFFRGEIEERGCRAVLDKMRSHLQEGKLVLRSVNWVGALDAARRIAGTATARTGCRTLDVFHVAIAAQWGTEPFVSADDRQLRAARQAGLRTVDVRTFPRDNPSGGDGCNPPATVRETRTKYRTRKQTR
jgi:predicted nucleic acid-binding protein